MFYLIYTSRAQKLMSTDDLLQILERSRVNNEASDITGMLIYMEARFLNKMEGRFIQMLEGPESKVRSLYDTILSDTRHRGILLLATGVEQKRDFENWSMAFKSVDSTATDAVPAFTELNAKLFNDGNPGPAKNDARLLKAFFELNNTIAI